MKLTPKMQVEVSHLLFLRQFASQTDPHLYAIKGGCNLRFFFNSVRYSEDLDIDVMTIQKSTLENKVNKILQSTAFAKSLREYDIHQLSISVSKQTTTTQRWKIQLHIPQRMSLNTKIEFSRRNKKMNNILSNITTSVCQHYHLPPMRLSHYDIQEAIVQKIDALAYRSVTQARDIFDLYHLLHIAPHVSQTFTKSSKEKAIMALASIHFSEYKSQVISFLDIETQNEFDSKEYWKIMVKLVRDFIENI